MEHWVPSALFAAATAVLAVGCRLTRNFACRGRYIAGLVLVALSFAVFWPVHVVFSQWVEKWGIYGVLAALPFLLSVFLFAGGLALIVQAHENSPGNGFDDRFS